MMAKKRNAAPQPGAAGGDKAPLVPMSEHQKLKYVVRFTRRHTFTTGRCVLPGRQERKLGQARSATITGLNETGIGHVLSGRRKNLTAETIAILAQAMLKRPRLVLEDLREPARSAAASARRSAKVRGPRAARRRGRTGA